MNRLSTLFIVSLFLFSCKGEKQLHQNIVTSDIYNFWEAYDKIKTTEDTTLQMKYLKELYLDKGTVGLAGIMKARNYQPEEYLNAIRNYPKYWASIRESTLSADEYASEIQTSIEKFKELYPLRNPAKVYFEIGVFRTGGTSIDSLVIIGAELAMADSSTDVSELPESLNYVKDYLQTKSEFDLAFTNVHEFVHSQQNYIGGYDLLSQSIFEGLAEFVAEIAMGKSSNQTSLKYGKANEEKVKARFVEEMFSPSWHNWIWNDTENIFKTRDLGYFMGYAIVSKYYKEAEDKKGAIKEMIELDFSNPEAIENFVQKTGYFSEPISSYRNQFEKNKPTVISLEEIENKSNLVNPNLKQFTVNFSQPMDKRFRSTGYGEKGEDYFPKVTKITFSEDGTKAVYELELEPNKEYQFIINEGYLTLRGIPLVSYEVSFKTGE